MRQREGAGLRACGACHAHADDGLLLQRVNTYYRSWWNWS